MRLLHVVPTYLPSLRYGGLTQAVHGLCRALAARGHEVTVVTTRVDGPVDSPVPLDRPVEIDGVRVRYFHSRWLRRLFWSPPMSRHLARTIESFDIVHLHSAFGWPTWAAARAARRAHRPYVLTPHGMLDPALIARHGRVRKRAWIRLAEAGNIEGAARIHVTVPAEAAQIEALGLHLPPVFVLPFGVDRPATGESPPRRAPETPPLVLFLGRLTWKKGLDRLIRAMALVPEARLAIAGNDEEGHRASVEALISACGLSGRVRVLGPTYGRAKGALLRSASVFALPSLGENLGVAVLEAMAEGVPVVVTPEVGLAPVIAESRAGRVVSGDPVALAAALRDVLADPAERAAMGERGRRLAAERYSWDVIAAEMERALTEVRETARNSRA